MASNDAEQLRDRLDQLNRWPTWHEAATAGVELVDHLDTASGIFHLANGDAVFPTADGWEMLDHVRSGVTIQSGTMRRIHNPGVDPDARIHPTARIDPTARVETGAVVGAHVFVGADAHIGRDAHIMAQSFIGPGAFIGTTSIIRGSCHIAPGAVIGAGSDLGACTQIGAGAQLAQGSTLDPFTAVTAGETTTAPPTRSPTRHAGQIAHMIERLATINREP